MKIDEKWIDYHNELQHQRVRKFTHDKDPIAAKHIALGYNETCHIPVLGICLIACIVAVIYLSS